MRAVEKRLRERIQRLEESLKEVEEDRDKFRDHFIRRFKWWLELLGSKQSPNIAWLVEHDAKQLVNFQKWYW